MKLLRICISWRVIVPALIELILDISTRVSIVTNAGRETVVANVGEIPSELAGIGYGGSAAARRTCSRVIWTLPKTNSLSLMIGPPNRAAELVALQRIG